MSGWVFTYSVDGLLAYEEGVYLDFDKAFERLCELNSEKLEGLMFYEKGYGIGYHPKEDKEMEKAKKDEDWELYNKLAEKHTYTDIKRFCKENCLTGEPGFGYYAIEEIDIHK